jgi:GNAT superfamily N-acetyltransferase
MNITQIDLSNKKQVRDFLDLPFQIYRDIPQWVPPLRMDDRLRLDPKRYPFYRHSQAGFFLACDGTRVVGRIAAIDNRLYNQYNNEATAFFYLFECENRQEVADALFEAACDWARERGLTKILGPKGFTVLDGFGALVKGFEHRPAFGLPYNPAYYPELIEAAGFQAERDAVSGYLGVDIQFPARIHELAERIARRRGLRIARYRTRKDLRAFVPKLKELYNNALRGTAGNAPLTDDEVKMMANQLLWFADPRLLKIVYRVEDPRKGSDEPVGFLMAYPDISAALQKIGGRIFPFGWISLLREFKRTDWLNINGAGLLPEYRGSGGTAILYSELFKSVAETGQFRHAEVIQVGMENENMRRDMENFGIDFYKVHRTYVRDL